MTRIMAFTLPIIIALYLYTRNNSKPNISSKCYLGYSTINDKIIIKKNINKNIQVGSLFKILSIITILDYIENERLNELITVKDYMLETIDKDAFVIGLKDGLLISIKELLYAAVLESSADALLVLAFYLFGSEKIMKSEMNKKANIIGLNNTRVMNINGLDARRQRTTLSDILKLMRYSLSNPVFEDIFTTEKYSFKYWENTIYNKFLIFDHLVGNDYLDGVKTGYTLKANRCMASISKSDDDMFITITAGAKSISLSKDIAYYDTIRIYDYLYSSL